MMATMTIVIVIMSPPGSHLQFSAAPVDHVAIKSAESEMRKRVVDDVHLLHALLSLCEAGVEFGSQ